MPIRYDKLIAIFKERGITSYTFRKNGVISQGVWTAIHSGKQIDMNSLAALCEFLQCQPGDLIEYVPESKEDPT